MTRLTFALVLLACIAVLCAFWSGALPLDLDDGSIPEVWSRSGSGYDPVLGVRYGARLFYEDGEQTGGYGWLRWDSDAE